MTISYSGKISIVTGGAAGIGKATAEAFAKRGATVIIADIDGEGAAKVAEGINAQGGCAESVRVDVSNLDSMRALVHGAHERYGQLDYIFNNAGIGMLADLRDMTFDDWHRILGINLHSVIYGTKLAYDIMAQQGFGHIINMSSGSGLFPSPMRTGYNTTKFGVVGLSQALRPEAAMVGVNVSVVCPGVVKTSIFNKADAPNFDRQKFLKQLERVKGQTTEEAAALILRGVDSNKGIITLSRLVSILWAFYRLSPALYERYNRRGAHALYQYRLT